MQQKNQKPRQARVVEKSGRHKTWDHERHMSIHCLGWNQCHVMHSEVGFMLHPLVDADANYWKDRFNKTGTRKGSHDHHLPWFAKQCQVMHAEVVFKLHPRADSDRQTSAAEKIRIQVQKKVEKSEIVNAEFRFIRHPRAGAEPQSSTRRQKLPQKRKIMRTVATGAHAEEHVERRCEANNCHVPHSKFEMSQKFVLHGSHTLLPNHMRG